MVDLPIELWHLIFDHLQLVDLSACAQVSKAVYLVVKSYRIREIAFTRGVHEWFHYTTPIANHKHRVDYSMASIMKRSSFKFNYLKRLKIGRRSAIDLDVINRFTRLEELDIDLKNYKNEQNRTISLANLKVLYLFVPYGILYVKLKTPKLVKVCTFSLKMLRFVYPESVRCIHTFFRGGKLSKFPNLEYLILTDHYNQLDYYTSFEIFDLFSVTALKKFKEVDFYYTCAQYRKKNMSNFKRMVGNLLALERPDLKVFWLHVQVTNSNLLTEYEHTLESVGSLVAFQLQNYEKLKEKIEFIGDYDFNWQTNQLLRVGLNPRSEELVSKLLARRSFRKIAVTGKVRERELLLKLIARSLNLSSLEFQNSGLDQSFFDRMADSIRLNAIPLRSLRLKNFYHSSSELLNFDFVSKLPDLELFETDQQLPNELISKLLTLPMLAEIKCTSGGIAKRIKRLSTNRFLLNEETLSLQELLGHFSVKPNSDSMASKCRLM